MTSSSTSSGQSPGSASGKACTATAVVGILAGGAFAVSNTTATELVDVVAQFLPLLGAVGVMGAALAVLVLSGHAVSWLFAGCVRRVGGDPVRVATVIFNGACFAFGLGLVAIALMCVASGWSRFYGLWEQPIIGFDRQASGYLFSAVALACLVWCKSGYVSAVATGDYKPCELTGVYQRKVLNVGLVIAMTVILPGLMLAAPARV